MRVRGVNRLQRLRQRANLVRLDQNRRRRAQLRAALDARPVGHKQIVAHHQTAPVQRLRQKREAFEIVLAQRIFYRNDGIFLRQRADVANQLLARHVRAALGQAVAASLHPARRGHIQREAHVTARLIARLFGGFRQKVERFLVAGQIRREPAFVAHRRGQPPRQDARLQRVIDLRAHAHRLGRGQRSVRHQHEFLNVHVVARVLPAVQNVHHQPRTAAARRAAQIAPQRQPVRLRRRARRGHRRGQHGVRAERRLILRAVQRKQTAVDLALLIRAHARERFANRPVHGLHGIANALPEVPLAAVALFGGLVRAR